MTNNHLNFDIELDSLKGEILQNQQNSQMKHASVSTLKLFMATQPQRELDRLSIENPRMFRHRYGMERPKAVRQKLIDIQSKYEWSDRDIRHLCAGGLLYVSHTEVKLKPNKLIVIGGWIQIVIVSSICIPMIFLITLSHFAPWKQLLGDMLIAVGWFGSLWHFMGQYIKPWQIFQRNSKLVSNSQIHNLTKF